MRQADIMFQSEADAWYNRNRHHLGQVDPVSDVMDACGIRPTSVLEIGCANGWRLAKIRDKYGCVVMGVEPSKDAVGDAIKSRIPVWECTAAALPIRGASYDVVIYGFCLYLADPSDWFRIVMEGDRVLRDDGYLVIYDFANHGVAWARRYEHHEGMLSYHVDFANLWLGNPLYFLVTRAYTESDNMVTVLRKRPVGSIKVLP